MDKFNSPSYKRSRGSYIAQCAFGYMIELLVADAFLAKLLTHLGISDALTGVISSFITLAFVVQLFSIFLLRANLGAKKTVMFFDTLGNLLFMSLFLLPFAPFSHTVKTACAVLCVLFAYSFKYLVLSISFKWANSYVDPTHRARYSGKKEMVSLAVGMIFTTLIGYIIDRFEGLGNLEGAFLFIAVSIFVINLCNFVCFALIKADSKKEREKESSPPLYEVIAGTLGNKNFRSVIILDVIWKVALYFTVGFIGVFKTNSLGMSLLLIQIINVVSSLCRIGVTIPFGKLSDKTSFAKGIEIALWIAAASFCINAFTTNTTWFFIIIYSVLYNCSLAGSHQNFFNITYNYVKPEFVSQAMAIKSCISGLFGFFASLAGGKILSLVQSSGNSLFGIKLYGQQLLSAISLIITLAAILYARLVVEKQEKTYEKSTEE